MTSISNTLCMDHVRQQLPTYKHERPKAPQAHAPVITKPITKAPVTKGTKPRSSVSRTLMTTPEIKMVTKLPNYPWSMIRRQDDTYYICYRSQRLTQVDSTGSIIKELTCDVDISDIAVHPSTDQMYCVHWGRQDVRLLDKTRRTKHLFDVDVRPRSMAVTSDDKILIGLRGISRVHVYSLLGDGLQTIDCIGMPWHITVCTSTNKVAIACGLGRPMVLDGRFKQLYTTKRYTCGDVEFDNHGHLLTLNKKDKRVFVLNAETGEMLQSIQSELFRGWLRCLVTQTNGYLITY